MNIRKNAGRGKIVAFPVLDGPHHHDQGPTLKSDCKRADHVFSQHNLAVKIDTIYLTFDILYDSIVPTSARTLEIPHLC